MAVLVQEHLDIDFYMTSPNDITLRKVGEPEYNSLPRGVHVIMLGGRVIFVQRISGRFIPLPEKEQETLRQKHVL